LESSKSYADPILPGFDREMASTRKVLERIPDDTLDWKAHPEPNTIGWNANHVADIPNRLVMVLSQPSLDIAPVGREPYPFPKLGATRESPYERSAA
jgi:DinB superfamily